jgi:catechol 2,3-dioxygenase-like lactoylglutathione lyase family enzyme
MKHKKIWTGYITEKVIESRDFYTRALGCEVIYAGEDDWFVLLKLGESELGFMQPNLDFQAPIFRGAYPGKGTWITIDVEDVNAEHQRIRGLGIPLEVELRDEPWGDRHFAILDPNGIGIDFVQRDTATTGSV